MTITNNNILSEKLSLPSPLIRWTTHPSYQQTNKTRKNYNILIKRDDLIHPHISGNKRRKISGYLDHHTNISSITTYGWAYSNHLKSIATIGQILNIPTTGIVRGDELANKPLNPNLTYCTSQKMKLQFIDRTKYRTHKHISNMDTSWQLTIPEGGATPLWKIGCQHIIQEIIDQINETHNVYFCIDAATGTAAAGTLQAIITQTQRHQITIPVLHDLPTIRHNLGNNNNHPRHHLISGYEHGGYAKSSPTLDQYISDLAIHHHIPSDHIYSGKLFFAVDQLIQQSYFPPESTIIIYHSGL